MAYRFDSGTGITVVNVSSNTLVHARPPVIPANKFIGGSSYRVFCCRVVVVGIDNFSIQVFIIRDIEEAVNKQEVIVDSTLV